MNTNITTYVPSRNRFGRFTSINWRKLARKTIAYQLIALSLVANVWFARHLYVVHCSAGGMFMTQEQCGELASLKADSQELARMEMLVNNQDLIH
jgi:hypothetical protein